MYRRVLVPLDGSTFSEAALPHARELAQCTGAEIALVRVAVQPLYEYTTDPILFETVREDTEAESAEYLERVVSELRAEGFKATAEPCSGPVAETILDYAQEIEADLIIMSTHGRSGFARWFIGSVADKIVRASRLPVLLVRPPGI